MKDRDVYTPKHPAAPEFVAEEATGVLKGQELRDARARRSTSERVERLEDKHDALAEVVTETRVVVGAMDAKLDAFIDTIKAERERARLEHETERVRIGSRAKIVVAVVGGLGAVVGALVTAMAGCG